MQQLGSICGFVARLGQAWASLGRRLEHCGVPLAGIALPIVVVLVSLVWLRYSTLSLRHPDGIHALMVFLAAAGLAIAASFFAWGRFIAAGLGLFAVIFGGFAATSLPSALGVALGWPLWDSFFLSVDRALGFDHPALLDTLVRYPAAVDVLKRCYSGSVPMVLLAGLVLIVLRRFDRLIEFNLMFAVTLVLVVGTSTFFTAAGLLVDLPVSEAVRVALPKEAGIYHMKLFEALRSGQPVAYAPSDNPGIVTFPSFHTCMALLVWYALRDDAVLKWPALVFCVLTIISTVPIGGHYVADVIAAAGIFAATGWWVARRGPSLETARETGTGGLAPLAA